MSDPEKLRKLIAKLSLKNNFWGYLFARIRRVADASIPSIMGVGPNSDGTISLFYNQELVEKTEDDALLLVLEHEGLHVLNKHISRFIKISEMETDTQRKNFKMLVWNYASDCAANDLMKMPGKIKIGGVEVNLVLPQTFDLPQKHAAEWYFYKLLEQMKENNICSECGAPLEEGDHDGKHDHGGESDGKEGHGSDSCCPGCGKSSNGQIGDHGKWKDSDGVADKNALARKLDQYTKDIVSETVKNFNKNRGDIPGSIQELIKELLKPPQVPYYQMIRKLVVGSRLCKFKRSPTKINRKRMYVFEIGDEHSPSISPFPGRTRDRSFNVSVMIDTSGSMRKDDIIEALSSCKDIIEKDRHCVITVIECDTHVQKEYQIKKIQDIQMDVKGRGGTTLLPGLERAKELGTDITLAFTDGYCENLNEVARNKLPRKIVWIVGEHSTTETIDKTGYIVRINT